MTNILSLDNRFLASIATPDTINTLTTECCRIIREEVFACLERGWSVTPLCWPDAHGRCACPKHHALEKEIGKAPLLGTGYQNQLLTPEEVERLWSKYPLANYGILLKPSGLLVIDSDSLEADREVERLSVPPGPRVQTAKGVHRYFSNTSGVSGSTTKRGESQSVDVLAAGYVVGPGSLHRSQTRYKWEVTPEQCSLEEPPAWAVALLQNTTRASAEIELLLGTLPPTNLDAIRIPVNLKRLIKHGPHGDLRPYPSRSEAVFAALTGLLRAGYTDTLMLASILLDPRYWISEKPREQGRNWVASEIARAKMKCGNGSLHYLTDVDVSPDETRCDFSSTLDALPHDEPGIQGSPASPIYEATITRSPTDDWPVLANEALHGFAGEIVEAIDPHTEADRVAVLLNFLTALGNCINATAHASVGKDSHPARLFAVLVGETSKGRKGTGWSIPRYLFSLVDPDWTRDCIKGGLSSAEGLIYHVRDAAYKKQPVKERGRVIDYENVMVEEAVDDKRLLIIEPEFASTLTVMNRDGNTLSAVIREAWDNGNLATLTRNSPLKATNAHISMIGHITKQELLARLDDTSKGNGFANRFLFALVKRSKELPEGGEVPEAELQRLAEDLSRIIRFSRTVSLVQRDAEAKALWASIYHDLSDGKPGLVGSIISRAEAQVLRLSLLYALLDESNLIRVEHLKAALALWDYCEKSAVLIFGERLDDPTTDRILEAIRNAGSKGQTENNLYELFGKHKSANERANAIQLLLSFGLIEATKEETRGRPRTVYRAA